VAVDPSPCASYPGTLNRVVWCGHPGGHVWPGWAGAAIRSFFLGVSGATLSWPARCRASAAAAAATFDTVREIGERAAVDGALIARYVRRNGGKAGLYLATRCSSRRTRRYQGLSA
jgi:hypothetical protein